MALIRAAAETAAAMYAHARKVIRRRLYANLRRHRAAIFDVDIDLLRRQVDVIACLARERHYRLLDVK